MPSILTVSDFSSGMYTVPTNTHTAPDLLAFIEKYERQFLLKVLGKALYDSFIVTVVNGAPVGASYLAIFNPISVEINKYLLDNNGMKEMLKKIIYFYFIRSKPWSNNDNGTQRNQVENGANCIAPDLTSAYNSAVTDARVIQSFIMNTPSDYPTYNGSCIEYITGF